MDVEGDDGVGSDCFKEARDIPYRHWILRFGAPVFTGVTQIWRHHGYAPGTAIFECADKEQKPAQLIIRALLGLAVQAVQYENVGAADCLERPSFVLAVIEFAMLMRSQRSA
jgi:hypothetical protein